MKPAGDAQRRVSRETDSHHPGVFSFCPPDCEILLQMLPLLLLLLQIPEEYHLTKNLKGYDYATWAACCHRC